MSWWRSWESREDAWEAAQYWTAECVKALKTIRSQQKGMQRMARKIKALRERNALLEGAYKAVLEDRDEILRK